jgi:hypothetical protein
MAGAGEQRRNVMEPAQRAIVAFDERIQKCRIVRDMANKDDDDE